MIFWCHKKARRFILSSCKSHIFKKNFVEHIGPPNEIKFEIFMAELEYLDTVLMYDVCLKTPAQVGDNMRLS